MLIFFQISDFLGWDFWSVEIFVILSDSEGTTSVLTKPIFSASLVLMEMSADDLCFNCKSLDHKSPSRNQAHKTCAKAGFLGC
nr:hypothetical protein [Mucilaginibacter sp. X5P1]